MRIKFLLTLIIITSGYSAMAQFKWPEQPEERSDAQTKWTLFSDTEKAGNYDAAKGHLAYILEHFPDLSESTYIKGIAIWDESWENGKTEAEKEAAAAKVMSLYEMRFKMYPESKKENIGRQAISAYRYFIKDASKTQYLLDLFKLTYELEGNEGFYSTGRYYMQTAVLGYTRDIGLTDEQILDIYNKCTEHIDYQIKKAKSQNKSTKSMDAVKEFVDEKLANLNLIDCAFIIEKLVPQFKANPKDGELANKIFVYAYDGGCTDAEWFLDAAKAVLETKPQYGVANLLASTYVKEKDYVNAKIYYNKAIEIAEDNTDKGKAMKQIVLMERLEGNKAEARKLAIATVEIDPTLKEEMYTLIGDMVMQSTECDQQKSQVDDRAKFIVAYEYYTKGGNQLKASQAKAQFPSGGEIFTEGKELGDSVTVGCWIQQTVKLQKRPEQQ
ncbi:hypothetical protein [Roseivirga echinicomitans]|uniref:Tetratricopeptide repeat protein n=1 Tax=Roseivirga echinicomitans TaxID=296218 RepID=A0A150XXY1_9BACT|nr:hypothetical protein [Roseivirga echinicomitans]KYG83514.1 hypothetical protein AWN68_01540 [Roseivirga echinicomitans]